MRKPTIAQLSLALLAVACNAEEIGSPSDDIEAAQPGPVPDVAPMALTTSVALDQTGPVGRYTSLALGGGRLQLVYTDEDDRDLKIATCARSCSLAGSWTTGVIDQAALYGRLKIAPNGRRHLTYFDLTSLALMFATCAPTAGCTTAADWSKGRIESNAGPNSSLALGSDGSKQVSYTKTIPGAHEVKYATCLSGCTNPSSWSLAVIERIQTTGGLPGTRTSLAIGPDGRRHVVYSESDKYDLIYATCASNCANAANWQKLPIDALGQTGLWASLAVGSDGVIHASYYDRTNGDLKYARCAFDCTTAANWKKVAVWWVSDVGSHTSLAVEANGRVHLISYHETGTSLVYATCNANCTVSASWSRSVLDGVLTNVGMDNSLAVRSGVVHVGYYDLTNRDLKYLVRTP